VGDSRCPGSLGIGRLSLSPELTQARTPGSLGRLDAADPDVLACAGDTPGSLGLRDQAEPMSRFVPPLINESSQDYKDFEDRVLAKHLEYAAYGRPGHRRKHPRLPVPTIPDSELELVATDGKKEFRLRKSAAVKCKKLLEDARTALKAEQSEFRKKPNEEQEKLERTAKSKGEVVVTQVRSIGLTSAYRSFEYDSALWHNYYHQKYYRLNHAKLAQIPRSQGGFHGWKAVEVMVDFIAPVKAAPGYSNHTNGIAVDFSTNEGGITLTAETGKSKHGLNKHNERWEKSWFYKWLEGHKAEYGIERIPTEAWHWEFDLSRRTAPPKASAPAAAGSSVLSRT
jgi:LAS superfamily LD-carboxypeptidase LdcB